MLKKVIHVNQHKIRSNKKNKKTEPVITVKTYKSNDYGNTVEVNGPCRIVYRPNDPLECGAVCWIETSSDVVISE